VLNAFLPSEGPERAPVAETRQRFIWTRGHIGSIARRIGAGVFISEGQAEVEPYGAVKWARNPQTGATITLSSHLAALTTGGRNII
jgi:hypothetical protein